VVKVARKRKPRKVAKMIRRHVAAPKKKKKKRKMEAIGYTQGPLDNSKKSES
jgi:hypothetical protein